MKTLDAKQDRMNSMKIESVMRRIDLESLILVDQLFFFFQIVQCKCFKSEWINCRLYKLRKNLICGLDSADILQNFILGHVENSYVSGFFLCTDLMLSSYLAKSSISLLISHPTGECFFVFRMSVFRYMVPSPLPQLVISQQQGLGGALPCTQVLPLRVRTCCFHCSSGALSVTWRCEQSTLRFLSQ